MGWLIDVLLAATLLRAAGAVNTAGINFPPTQGSTNSGAFSTEKLSFDRGIYTKHVVQDEIIRWSERQWVRFGVNPPTVADGESWERVQELVRWSQEAGANVVLCLWDTPNNDLKGDGHGDGYLLGQELEDAAWMWWKVAQDLGGNDGVYFELLNEPFSEKYTEDVGHYMEHMNKLAKYLPRDRVIVNGLGYAADIQAIKEWWSGLLAFHVYPNFVSTGLSGDFSNFVNTQLDGVGHRTLVTEFGCNLTLEGATRYTDGKDQGRDVQFLNGVGAAFHTSRPKATFVWHGWNNGDAYSIYQATESSRGLLDRAQNY